MKDKQASKSVRILDILKAVGPVGMRFTDIQRALWEMSHARPFTRDNRGWWCTNLSGSRHHHRGLLHYYAVKGADGRWRRNDVSHDGKPWSRIERGWLCASAKSFMTVI